VDVVTFRDLEPKDDFMMLMDIAFWWPKSPRNMEEKITSDVRLKNGPVGFCAVEHDRLIGYVGVMDIPTKTAAGDIETVGGIWAVATNPGLARRGICKLLMERSHQYFQSRGYRFSFLCTSRTIIAYRIYREMEYEEVEAVNAFKAVYKVIDKPQPPFSMQPGYLEPDAIYALHARFAQGRCGFVVRQGDFVSAYSRWKRFDEAKSIYLPNGYALLSDNQNVTKVQDMAALDYDTYAELIDRTERQARAGVINRSVADPELLDLYRSKGYRVQDVSNSVVMVKHLADAGFDQVYSKSFYIAPLDWF
jgi:predicted acetyltransferase